MNLNETEFELLGEIVTVETNNSGTSLYITFGNQVIENSNGDCVSFPYLSHLNGAALVSAMKKNLKETAESAIAAFITSAAEQKKQD